jgi:twitching motility protein PilT
VIETPYNIDDLLNVMFERNASDLHLTAGSPPVIRVTGRLERLTEHEELSPDEIRTLMYRILSTEQQKVLETRRQIDFSHSIPGLARFRVNAYFQRDSVGAAFRLIPDEIKSLEQLGIPTRLYELADNPRGLVLVTGPTGSGKSTTLCALIDLINRTRTDHIITIEDPIEFVHENKKCVITQRQVGVHTDSFKRALRSALREDPDIVLVGEMRDLETIAVAIETAETGHLVFGTLHTTTAATTVDRIIDQFPADRQSQIRVMLSESLKGVIAQTLCKKVGGGRVAAREILLTTPAIANLIREGKTFQIPSIIQTSKQLGMLTLNDALLELVEKKEISADEAYLKSVEKAGLAGSLKAKGHKLTIA